MIRYRLSCDQGHEFEAWFRNSAVYDEQRAADQVECPECGSADISKTLMTPGIPSKRGTAPSESESVDAAGVVADMARKLRAHVEANADYVGDRFAEEARKIHYEEVKPRGIYGEATKEESKELADEGIEVGVIPWVPRADN